MRIRWEIKEPVGWFLKNDPRCCLRREIFDPTVDEIVRVTNAHLQRAAEAPGGLPFGADKVLIVGGFGSSPYLQGRIKREVRAPAAAPGEILTLKMPYAAVVQGAVLYGADPEVIHARRARYTYGIRACSKFMEGDLVSSKVPIISIIIRSG